MTVFLASIGLLLASCFYAPWLIVKLLAPAASRGRRWGLQALGSIACLAVVLGYSAIMMSGSYTLAAPLHGALYNGTGLLFMAHVYLTLCAIVIGIALLLGARRHPHLRRGAGFAALLVPAAAVTWGFITAQGFEITRLNLEVDGLERPVTFAHLPDIHLGHQRDERYLRKVLAAVARERPDFILYNGDLFDSNAGLKPEVFATLAAVDTPQYFTTGNHEFYMDTTRSLELLAAAGVRILRSQVAEVAGVQLAGLEYMNADGQSRDPHSVNTLTMDVELPKITVDASRPVLLAHHSPVGYDYAADYGADVYVAGHTHAGQIWPATWLVGLNFPHYKGVQQHRGMQAVVSQGAGTFGPWMRLGSKNEVQLIRLQPANP